MNSKCKSLTYSISDTPLGKLYFHTSFERCQFRVYPHWMLFYIPWLRSPSKSMDDHQLVWRSSSNGALQEARTPLCLKWSVWWVYEKPKNTKEESCVSELRDLLVKWFQISNKQGQVASTVGPRNNSPAFKGSLSIKVDILKPKWQFLMWFHLSLKVNLR